MTFGEAVAAMKTGQSVARSAWTGPQRSIKIYLPNFISMSIWNWPTLTPVSTLPPFVESHKMPPSVESWGASHADLLAEDWIISGSF
jgi:hypothetical protein